MSKLEQAVVLYFPGKVIGSNVGAHCGDCWKFVGDEKQAGECIEVDGAINPAHGICGLYINGRIFEKGKKPDFEVDKVSKQQAGYIEDGPTHCDSCEYFGGRGKCEEVENKPETIEEYGCCNQWERSKSRMSSVFRRT